MILSVETESAAPGPEFVGSVTGNVFDTLADQIQPGKELEGRCSPEFLLDPPYKTVNNSAANKVIQTIVPISQAALSFYDNQLGYSSTEVEYSISNLKGIKPFFRSNSVWHRDLNFPTELTFVSANIRPTQFAEGRGINGLEITPNCILPILVNGLIMAGRLHVTQASAGDILAFDSFAIHKRPTVHDNTDSPNIRINMRVHSTPETNNILNSYQRRQFLFGYKKYQ